MSLYAKILSLSYNSAVATKSIALKSYWRSVRLIKIDGTLSPTPDKPSYVTNILLNGKCIDVENRNLYVFYIDTLIGSAWIIEINIDTRRQTVVYYDKYNTIGFDPLYKIHNARVVHGKLVWTDNKNPIYQMDITRAKKSFELKIGYGQYPQTEEWSVVTPFGIDQVVSYGNYFYKSLIHVNLGVNPSTDSGLIWKKLCLIEDAYYSMNIRNFYFEPIPPKLPPEVTYQTDDARKINNLRQTLFQVAYRYVYMDWRKSTFSPASIVPVPQSEEETATGLANELISLNNKLQIVVNTGGEEVRAIEVIGRSSDDPSKWFLIDTIEKFKEQEKGNEISRIAEPGYIAMGFAISAPSVKGEIVSASLQKSMGMSILPPIAIRSEMSASPEGYGWLAVHSGIADAVSITFHCIPAFAVLVSVPDWVVVEINGYPWPLGETITDGDILVVYPKIRNLGGALSGLIVINNSIGDFVNITVIQAAAAVDPLTNINVTIAIDPDDTSGLAIVSAHGNAFSRSYDVALYCTLSLPGNPSSAQTIFWRALVNGVDGDSGTIINAYLEGQIERSLTLNNILNTGDAVGIYLSIQPILESLAARISFPIIPLSPEMINSEVSLSTESMSWSADSFGTSYEIASVVTCPPVNCILESKPDWITVTDSESGYELAQGATIYNGQVLFLFPTIQNIGGAKSGSVTFTNSHGDNASISIEQSATSTPPADIPITCIIEKHPDDPSGLVIESYSAIGVSGKNYVTWNCVISGWYAGILYWKAYRNSNTDFQGGGSFQEQDGVDSGVFMLDNVFFPHQVIYIYFSTVPF
jgi:hypothetical protein